MVPHVTQARRLHKFEAIRAWGRGWAVQANPTTLWGDPGAMWDMVGL